MTDLDALLTRFATPPLPQPPAPAAARILDEAERAGFDFEDTQVATYAWGPADGPSCVVLHGWGSKAADMVAFVRPLARKGWRVTAIDAPAHGRSRGSGGIAETSMMQFTRMLRAFIAARGGAVDALVGHSIGAGACCYACAPNAPVPGPVARAGRVVLLGVPVCLATITRNFLDREGVPDQDRAAFRALVEGHYAIRTEAVDIRRHLDALPGPVLLAHDRDDEEAPYAEAESLAALLPLAEMVTTEGLGHAGLLTAPRVLRAAAAFMTLPDNL